MEALADADLVLVVLDASQARDGEDQQLLQQVAKRQAIVVENKVDLVPSNGRRQAGAGQSDEVPRVQTSALTGAGIGELRAEILKHVGGEGAAQRETGFLTSVRHQKLVRDSLAALDAASQAVQGQVPHEMLLLDLYNALRPLDEITGATTTDDILNLIFSTFCIGK